MKLERLDDSSIQLREITLSCHIAILMEMVGVWTCWGWGGLWGPDVAYHYLNVALSRLMLVSPCRI